MAEFNITAPDGNTYKITAPEGANEQDVLSFVQKSISNPEPEPQPENRFETNLPPETVAGRPNKPLDASYFINRDVIPNMSTTEKLANLYSHGAHMTGAGIGQLGRKGANLLGLYPDEKLKAYNDSIKKENELMEPLRQSTGLSGMLSEGAGSAMPILPVGAEYQATKFGPRVFEASKIGAKAASTQPALSDNLLEEKAKQVGIGAVTGPLAQETLILGSKPLRMAVDKSIELFNKFKPNKPFIDASGNPTQEFQIVLEQQGVKWTELADEAKNYLRSIDKDSSNVTGHLKPSQVLAEADYNALNMPRTRGQLLRDNPEMNMEQVLAGTPYGSELNSVFDTQNRRMIQNIEKMQGRTGITTPNKYDVGENVSETINKHFAKVQSKKIDPLYENIKTQYGDELINPRELWDEINVLQTDRVSLGKLNLLKHEINKAKQSNLSPANMKALKSGPDGETIINYDDSPITVEQAENIRKQLGEWANEATAKGNDTEVKFYNKFIEQLEGSVEKKLGQDVYAPARALAKTEKLDFLDSRSVDRAYRSTQGHERWFETSVVNDNIKIKEVKEFLGLLGKAGKDGLRTKRQVQSLTLEWLLKNSTKNTGRTGMDDAKFSVPAFKKALNKLGYSERGKGNTKLEIIFNDQPEIKKLLGSMLRAGERNIPVPLTNTGSDTASKLSWFASILDKLPSVKSKSAGNAIKKLMVQAKAKEQAKTAVNALPDNALDSIKKEFIESQNKQRAENIIKSIINTRTPLATSLLTEQERR